jgi:serine O-acetyltransferase
MQDLGMDKNGRWSDSADLRVEPDGRGSGVPTSFRQWVVLLREDYQTMKRSWTRPGLHATAVYRFGKWGQTLHGPSKWLVRALYRVLYNYVRGFYSVQLPLTADIGRRVLIPHFGHVFIGDYVRIGDDCLIRHNVTIGGRDRGRSKEAPTLEAGVKVGAGAVIMGKVTVGAGAKIGPNAVVYTDIAPEARVFARDAVVRPPKARSVEDQPVSDPDEETWDLT